MELDDWLDEVFNSAVYYHPSFLEVLDKKCA